MFTAPPVGQIRIGHGNVFIRNPKPASAVMVAKRTKSDSFGFNEAANIAPRLEALRAWESIGAERGFKDMRDAHDCITIVQHKHVLKFHSVIQASKDVEPTNIARDRVITTVAYKKKGLPVVAHINIHPNPVNFLVDAPHARKRLIVQEYKRNMKALRMTILFLEGVGIPHIVVTGDFNITQTNARKNEFDDPYKVASDFFMNAFGIGLDGVLWTKNLALKKKQEIAKSVTGSDHPWFFFDFKPQ